MVEIIVDGQVRRVNGRIEQLIRSILSKVEIITRNDKVHVGFDCAGPSVSIEIKVREVVP
jgi:tetrahydromethanopterin S-methyltransferase subunit F